MPSPTTRTVRARMRSLIVCVSSALRGFLLNRLSKSGRGAAGAAGFLKFGL
ncbi:MAG: hypothetical protein IPN99_14220 [Bacteroidetes bacterium]|nr:hypothetical protein [Bacteroidota bacterium]